MTGVKVARVTQRPSVNMAINANSITTQNVALDECFNPFLEIYSLFRENCLAPAELPIDGTAA